MARNRHNQADPKVIGDWIEEGRGKGRNGEYQTWLRMQNLASKGQSQRIPSHITGDRIVHTLSNHETRTFFIYEASPLVVDIREQFPLLPQSATIEIARELGVDHPCDNLGRPYVMTTDQLVTIKVDGLERNLARAIKEVKELSSKDQRIKLEIARRFHERRGEQWGIITERDIPEHLAQNVEILREYRDITSSHNVPAETITRVGEMLLPLLWKRELSLSDAAGDCDKQLGLKPGTSLTVSFHCLCIRNWTIDLMQPLETWKPLALITPKPKEV